MGGGTKTKTTQEPQVPSDVRDLTQASTEQVKQYQQAAPLTGFAAPNVAKVAPLSAREQSAYSKIPRLSEIAQRRVTGSSLFQDPSQYSYTGPTTASGGRLSPEIQSLNEAFDIAARPSIENAATLGGLGRSTALTNATASARAQYLAPAMQEALAREERANQGEAALTQAEIAAESGAGATERGIEQAGYEAEQADYLRRQALAEQSVYQVLGQLVPSTIGQQSSTRGKQGVFTA